MTSAIICDIDGTLADCRHRLHFVHGKVKDWTAFFDVMGEDGLIAPVAEAVSALNEAGNVVLLVSGRPEGYREATELWLASHGVSYDALYMRCAGDRRPDHIVKSQIFDAILADGYDVRLVIDDRPSVVAMWRERGLICLQADPGNEGDDESAPGVLSLMVGPSGAGKSTWLSSSAAAEYGIHPSHVVSSDQFRADLCGDFRDQTKNAAVFAAVHSVTRTRLRAGLPAVVDATNLRRKDRLAVVACAPVGASVRYFVCDRPMDEKKRDAGWRAEVEGLLERHDQTFRSQIKDIMAGDGLPHVSVVDLRRAA